MWTEYPKPLLDKENPKLGREALYFHYPHYHHINSMGPSGAIRMGDYKLRLNMRILLQSCTTFSMTEEKRTIWHPREPVWSTR